MKRGAEHARLSDMARKKIGIEEAATVDPAEEKQKMQYVLQRKHVAALREEAFKRAQKDGTYQPDASALLREILDGWMGKRR